MVEMIKEALALYGMRNASYELIRQNENITCKVKHEGKAYVIRIHDPVQGFVPSIVTEGMSDSELFRSEAELLQYLASNGFEDVQKPVKALSGEYTENLKNGVPVMMLTWLEGSPIPQEDVKKYAVDIGRMAGRIHQAAKGFTGKRPHYDAALTDRMIAELQSAIATDHIKVEDGIICMSELKEIREMQERLDSHTEPSVIHADLGISNILVTEKRLIPIDFSLSGFSHPAQEVGMLMSNYQDPESIEEILRGFEESGEKINKEDAERFLSYSVLLFICMQHGKCYREEWFRQAMKRWCSTIFVHWA